MAKSKESFDRRQRERAKKAKVDAKRERRQSKSDAPADEPATAAAPRVDEDVLIGALGKLHEEFDDGKIGFDDFEARRTELLSRLQVD